mmetsp:Transcript_29822/g.71100  ORF Transcript_29822/g.71100 Transcript_29822/m.71100 type:complete len:151 (+) Transcript_29822:119-571(+)
MSHFLRSHLRSAVALPAEPIYAVFGATGGIGSALCEKLAATEGSKVAMIARSEEKLYQLKSQLTDKFGQSLNGRILPITADPLDSKQTDSSIQQVVNDYGRLDGVSNCVGSVLLKSAHATTDKEVRVSILTFALFAGLLDANSEVPYASN